MIPALAVLLLLLSACSLLRSRSTDPGDEFKYKKNGRIDGVTVSDFDRVHDASFSPSTHVRVQINGNEYLNVYEFKVTTYYVTFGKVVTINPDGSITYQNPPVPAVPKGTAFTVWFDND